MTGDPYIFAMFGFGRKKKKENEQEIETVKKKKSRTDKLVMGAIIGVAVGSVVGMSLKHKGELEETERPSLKAPPSETPEPRSRLGRLFRRIFGGKKKNNKKPVHHGAGFRKIPNEWD